MSDSNLDAPNLDDADLCYLDHNATTPVMPEAIAAMVDACERTWGNPSSSHAAGRRAKALVDDARAAVAAVVDASVPEAVTFVSGATEGINAVIASVGPGRIVCTAVEHPAVLAAVEGNPDQHLELVPVDERGQVTVDALLSAVDQEPRPALVCVMAANNETGVLQPLGELVRPLHARGIPMMVDAVQLCGKLAINFYRPDYLIVTAHKLGGPKGIGAVVRRDDEVPLLPLILGGGQEHGARCGTEAVPAIAGFGAAMKVVAATHDEEARRMWDLRDKIGHFLLDALPGSRVVGEGAPRLPNTLSFMLPEGVTAAVIGPLLDAEGICISAGAACHAGTATPSRVLKAMGFSDDEALRVIRISVGRTTTVGDARRLCKTLPGLVAGVLAGGAGPTA